MLSLYTNLVLSYSPGIEYVKYLHLVVSSALATGVKSVISYLDKGFKELSGNLSNFRSKHVKSLLIPSSLVSPLNFGSLK